MNRLQNLPSNRVLGALLALCLTLALAAQINLQLTFRAVDHPISLGAANLEADVGVVRGWYRLLIDQGTYLQMIRTEVVDLLWAVALALAIASLHRFIAGMLRHAHPPIAGALLWLVPLAVLGPVFDLVENAFSLAMLTDPFGFPEWLAVAHVVASWLKITFAVAAATVGPTLTVIAVVSVRRARKRDGARPSRGARKPENAPQAVPPS